MDGENTDRKADFFRSKPIANHRRRRGEKTRKGTKRSSREREKNKGLKSSLYLAIASSPLLPFPRRALCHEAIRTMVEGEM